MTVRLGGVDFEIRAMTPLDRNAVFATWMRSAREAVHEHSDVPSEVFEATYPKFVERCLDRERTAVLYREESPGVVHAWACAHSSDVLHWAYVPFKLRGEGIGRAVITAALVGWPERVFVTTPVAPGHPRFVFSPFMAGP